MLFLIEFICQYLFFIHINYMKSIILLINCKTTWGASSLSAVLKERVKGKGKGKGKGFSILKKNVRLLTETSDLYFKL